MNGLTERQEQFINVVRTYTDLHGYGPSIREIGATLGIPSPNGVISHVKALIKKGYLTGSPRMARTLRVVDHDRMIVSRRAVEQVLHEVLDGQPNRAIALLEEILSQEIPNAADVPEGEHRQGS